jgi:ATP-dependent DNA helicase RecQ
LVIDEAQDMNEDEFHLIQRLMEENEEMRVIAVGDDDQNIFEFRGASSKYLRQFIEENNAVKNELVENYRSKSNLVHFTNQFVKQIRNRLKTTPIIPMQLQNGKIKLVHYQSDHLITPLVADLLSTSITGSTCVLTKTNEDALQITGLLLKNGLHATLIQSNEGFSLYHLLEVRYFLSHLNLTDDQFIITDEAWENAKKAFSFKFDKSSKMEIVNNLIEDFEVTNPKKKYKSDFEVFIRESKLEDFITGHTETIFVSTIHKSKGKEFDNLYLMLENFNLNTEESKRQLYVAMTRAKNNLTIHLNAPFLDSLTAENIEYLENQELYAPPKELAIQLTHKDVWLDYFTSRQYAISQLISGEKLYFKGDECFNSRNQSVLKFSKQFMDQIELLKQKNYELKSAAVNFIVYWTKEGTDYELKIVLPELTFEHQPNEE